MIKEVNGRYQCTDCGRYWSAMLGDNEIPEKCSCVEEIEELIRQGIYDSPDFSSFSDHHIQIVTNSIVEVLNKQGLRIVKEVV